MKSEELRIIERKGRMPILHSSRLTLHSRISPLSCTFCRLDAPAACDAVFSGQVAMRQTERHLLPLIPSGPDGVRGLPPRRTRPSTTHTTKSQRRKSLKKDLGH